MLFDFRVVSRTFSCSVGIPGTLDFLFNRSEKIYLNTKYYTLTLTLVIHLLGIRW